MRIKKILNLMNCHKVVDNPKWQRRGRQRRMFLELKLILNQTLRCQYCICMQGDHNPMQAINVLQERGRLTDCSDSLKTTIACCIPPLFSSLEPNLVSPLTCDTPPFCNLIKVTKPFHVIPDVDVGLPTFTSYLLHLLKFFLLVLTS